MKAFSPSAPPRRAWSLTTRLFLFYVGSVALLLGACFGGLYLSLSRKIAATNRELLQQQTALVGALIENAPDAGERLAKMLRTGPGRPADLPVSVRLLRESGEVVAETPGMNRRLPVPAFPVARAAAFEFRRWESPEGKEYLVTASLVPSPSGQPWSLQVALVQTGDEKLVHVLRRNTAVALLAGALLAAGLGAWVARRALDPLNALTQATTAVTASQLHARFNTTGWPEELAALAASFEQMLARLEESFLRLSQFSANLSHELRTPINNLRGEAEVALSRARSPEEYRTVLESSLEEYHRLARLIDNVLFLARAENAASEIVGERLDVAAELRAVADFYEAAAEEQQVTLVLRGGGQLRADAVFLRRMLGNLLDNALRHTSAGGRIELAAEPHRDGRLEIAVSDTGEGIPAAKLARIYDRFYRGVERQNGPDEGFGLGLPIVKSIMQLHGGAISVESELGRGTRVRLVFPAERVG